MQDPIVPSNKKSTEVKPLTLKEYREKNTKKTLASPKESIETKKPITLKEYGEKNIGNKLFEDASVANLGASQMTTPISKYSEGFVIYDDSLNPYAELEEYKATMQPTLDQWGNGISRLGLQTLTKTGQAVGHMAGLATSLVTLDSEYMINNDLVNLMDDLSEKVREMTPIYEREKTKDGISHYFSSKFLLGDLLGEGGSFLASAWLTGAGMGKLTEMGSKAIGNSLAKIAAGDANKVLGLSSNTTKLSKWTYDVLQGSTLPKNTAVLFNTYVEGAFEARETYKTSLDEQIKNYREEFGDDVEINDDIMTSFKQNALDGSRSTLIKNMFMAPLNGYQYNALWSKANKSNNYLKQILSAPKATTKAGKILEKTRDLGIGTFKTLKGGIQEGLQEGIQQAISDVSVYNSVNGEDANFLESTIDVFKTFGEKFADREYMEQMVAGFLLGSPFTAFETAKEMRQERNSKEGIRNAFEKTKSTLSELGPENIYETEVDKEGKAKKDDKGNIIYKKNKEGQLVLKTAARYAFLEAMKNSKDISEDATSFLKEEQFINMAFQMFETGLADRFQDELTIWGKKTVQEFADDNVIEFEKDKNTGRELSPVEISEIYKKKATALKEIYDQVEKRFYHFDGNRKRATFIEAARQQMLVSRKNEMSAKSVKSAMSKTSIDENGNNIDSPLSLPEQIALQEIERAILTNQYNLYKKIQEERNPNKESTLLNGGISNRSITRLEELIKERDDILNTEQTEELKKEIEKARQKINSDNHTIKHIDNFKKSVDYDLALEDSYDRFNDLVNNKTFGEVIKKLDEKIKEEDKQKQEQDNIDKNDDLIKQDFRNKLKEKGYVDFSKTTIDGDIKAESSKIYYFTMADKDGETVLYKAVMDPKTKQWNIWNVEENTLYSKSGEAVKFDFDFYKKNRRNIDFVSKKDGDVLAKISSVRRTRTIQLQALSNLERKYLSQKQDNEKKIKDYEERKVVIEKDLKDFLETKDINGEFNAKEFEDIVNKIKNELSLLTKEIEALKNMREIYEGYVDAMAMAIEYISQLSEEEHVSIGQLSENMNERVKILHENLQKEIKEGTASRSNVEEIKRNLDILNDLITRKEEEKIQLENLIKELQTNIDTSKALIKSLTVTVGTKQTQLLRKYPSFPFGKAKESDFDKLKAKSAAFIRFIDNEAQKNRISFDEQLKQFYDYIKNLPKKMGELSLQEKTLSELENTIILTTAKYNILKDNISTFIKAKEQWQKEEKKYNINLQYENEIGATTSLAEFFTYNLDEIVFEARKIHSANLINIKAKEIDDTQLTENGTEDIKDITEKEIAKHERDFISNHMFRTTGMIVEYDPITIETIYDEEGKPVLNKSLHMKRWAMVMDKHASKFIKKDEKTGTSKYYLKVFIRDHKNTPVEINKILNEEVVENARSDRDIAVVLVDSNGEYVKANDNGLLTSDGNIVFTFLPKTDTMFPENKNPKINYTALLKEYASFHNTSYISLRDKLDSENITHKNIRKHFDIQEDDTFTVLELKQKLREWGEKHYELFLSELTKEIDKNNDTVLLINGVNNGIIVKEKVVDENGKKTFKKNNILKTFASSGLSLKEEVIGQKDSLEGGQIEVSTRAGIKVKGSTEPVMYTPGIPILKLNNGDIIPLKARNINENEVTTILYLLKETALSKDQLKGTVNFGADQFMFHRGEKVTNMRIFPKFKGGKSDTFSAMYSLIFWGKSYSSKTEGSNNSDIFINKGHVIFHNPKKWDEQIAIKLTDIVEAFNEAESLKDKKSIYNNEKIKSLVDFLLTKRINISRENLNTDYGKYLHPTVTMSNGKYKLEWSSFDNYNEFLLSGKKSIEPALFTDVISDPSYPKRASKNFVLEQKKGFPVITSLKDAKEIITKPNYKEEEAPSKKTTTSKYEFNDDENKETSTSKYEFSKTTDKTLEDALKEDDENTEDNKTISSILQSKEKKEVPKEIREDDIPAGNNIENLLAKKKAEQEAKKLSKKDILDAINKKLEDADNNKDNDEPVSRLTILTSKQYKKGDQNEARTWLNDKLGLKEQSDYEFVTGLIEQNSFGQFTKDARILLDPLFEKGTEYHEGFHRVFRMYLTNEQRQSLYNEFMSRNDANKLLAKMKKSYPKLNNNRLIEEVLAEEFKDYVLSNGRTVEEQENIKGFFNKLFHLIKTLINKIFKQKTLTINDLYKNIQNAKYNGKPLLQDAQFLDNANRSITIGKLTLSAEEHAMLMSSTNALFMNKAFSITTPDALISKNFNTEPLYNYVKSEIQKGIKDRITELSNKVAEIENSPEEETILNELERLADIYAAITRNFNDVIREHGYWLTAYKISLKISEDNIDESKADNDDGLSKENENDVDSRSSLDTRSMIEHNTKDSMPNAIKLLIATATERYKNKDKTQKLNKFGLPYQANWNDVTNLLNLKLASIPRDLDVMIAKMRDLSDKFPSLIDIINNIGGDYNDMYSSNSVYNTDYEKIALRVKFVQAFGNTKYDSVINMFKYNGNISIIESNTTQTKDNNLMAWKSNLQSKLNSYESVGDYIEDLKAEKNYLKLSKLLGINLEYDSIIDEETVLGGFSQSVGDILVKIKEITVKFYESTKNKEDFKVAEIYTRKNKKYDVKDYLSRIAEIDAKHKSVVDLQHYNSENKAVWSINLNTYQSLIIDTLNYYSGNEEMLKKELPHLFNVYTKNNLILNNILKGGTIVNTLSDGVKIEDQEGTSQSKLRKPDLYTITYNQVLQGLYPSIKHGDRKVFPAYRILDSYKNNLLFIDPADTDNPKERAIGFLIGYAQNEIARTRLLKDKNIGADVEYYKKNALKGTIIPNILGQDVYDNLVEGKLQVEDKYVYNKFYTFLENMVKDHVKSIQDNGLSEEFFGKGYRASKKSIFLSEEVVDEIGDIDKAIEFAVLNSLISHIEEIALFHGDLSLYASKIDVPKRLHLQSSSGSPLVNTKETNEYIEEANNEDKFIIGGIEYKYNKKINGMMTEMIINDNDFISKLLEIPEGKKESIIESIFRLDLSKNFEGKELEDRIKSRKKAYENYKETDAISLINLFFLREYEHKAGYWTTQKNNSLKRELKTLEYDLGTKEYEDLFVIPEGMSAKEYLEKEYEPFSAHKPNYVGPSYNTSEEEYSKLEESERINVISGRKTMYFPLIPSVIKGTILEDVMKFMMINGVDALHFKSGAKFGVRETRSFYNIEESNTNGFNSELTEEQKASQISFLPMKYMKDQVRISNKSKSAIKNAIQSRRNLLEGTANDSFPQDIVNEYEDITNTKILRNLVKLEKKLNVTKTKEGIIVDEYKLNDMKAIVSLLIEEARSRNKPDNIIDSINSLLIEDNKLFIETLPNSNEIQNLLNSIVRNNVLIEKRTGDGKIQVPSFGMERKGLKRNIINGKIESTSDSLKFYEFEQDENGNITKIHPKEIAIALPVNMIDNVLKHYNTRSIATAIRLLNNDIKKGVIMADAVVKDLRIPNQQFSSNGISKIKEFLIPTMESVAFVPSEMVPETGSDYDVDKIQIYFPNIDNKLNTVKYLDDSISIKERYSAYVWDQATGLDKKTLFAALEKVNIQEQIDERIADAYKKLIESPDIDYNERLQHFRSYKNELFQYIREAKVNDLAKIAGIMSIDEFSNLSIMEQNSDEALENRLIEIEREMMLHPSQAANLLYAVDDSQLKKLADEILGKDRNDTDYLSLITLDGNVKNTDSFMAAKAGVGVIATNVGFLGIARRYKYEVNKNYKVEDKEYSSQLLFEGMEDKYDLYEEKDINGDRKSLALSALVTSQVDALKDKYASDLNIIVDTLNIIGYMVMRGVPIDTIIKFIKQPVISDFIKTLNINKSKPYIYTGSFTKSRENLQSEFIKRNQYKGTYGERIITNEALDNALNKGDMSYQIDVFNMYLNLERQSKIYGMLKSYLSPDTKYLKNKVSLEYTLFDLRDSIEKSELFVDFEKAIEKGSLLHPFAKGRASQYSLFKEKYLTSNKNISKEISTMKANLSNANVVYGDDNVFDMFRDLEEKFVLYVLQKSLPEIFNTNKFLNLFTGSKSLPARILNIQKNKKHVLNENNIIKSLLPLINNSYVNNIKVSNLKLKQTSIPTVEVNLLEESMLDIKQNDLALYEDLIIFNLFQSGISNSPYQLQKVFPIKERMDMLNMINDFINSDSNLIKHFFYDYLRSTKLKYVPSDNKIAKLKMYDFDVYKKRVPNIGMILVNSSNQRLLNLGNSINWINYNLDLDVLNKRAESIKSNKNYIFDDHKESTEDRVSFNDSMFMTFKSTDTLESVEYEFDELKKEEKYEFNDNKKSSLSDAINKEIPTFKEYERILKDKKKEGKLSEKEFNELSLQEKETLIWQAKNCK